MTDQRLSEPEIEALLARLELGPEVLERPLMHRAAAALRTLIAERDEYEHSFKLYDFTQLSCLGQCEEEFVNRYLRHLARPEPDASAHFGMAVHAGVRALFDGLPQEAVEDAVTVAWAGADFSANEKKAHLTLTYAQAVVGAYHENYFSKLQPFEMVMNEQYLEWPERLLCGIVDRVVRSKADGQLYVMDLKTTGLYLGQAWFEQWRHSLQAAIYLDLVERQLDFISPYETVTVSNHVAGFMVDAIHIDRRGVPRATDFVRAGPFAYSQELRQEMRELVKTWTERARFLRAHPEEAMKNPRQCYRFNSLCPFFNLCIIDPSVRNDAMQMAVTAGDYEEVPWIPSNRK
jgi:hypothetical protein